MPVKLQPAPARCDRRSAKSDRRGSCT
jgi:hypothetical protein